MNKYDSQSSHYNFTRKVDPYILSRIVHFLSAANNDMILDIGCGTGNYTSEIQRLGFNVVGVDPSEGMLKMARENHKDLSVYLGEAEEIPFPNFSFDRIIASLTIHHWTNLRKGFQELSRVLKPNGRVVIFTATPKQMDGYWLNHYFPRMMEISKNKMPSFKLLKNLINAQNFEIISTEKYFIKEDLVDLFLYSGKHNPAFYLDPKFRMGISSFTMDSSKMEVSSGIEKLKNDIANNTINHVIKKFENDLGDYTFLVISNS